MTRGHLRAALIILAVLWLAFVAYAEAFPYDHTPDATVTRRSDFTVDR